VPVLPAASLVDYCSRLLEAAGLDWSEANFTAHSLVAANLRGCDQTIALAMEHGCGGAMASALGSTRFRGKPADVSQFYLALDPKCLLDPGELETRAAALTQELKATPAAKGYDEVLVAGEPELRKESERRLNGIPLAADTWQMLVDWGDARGIEAPA
jgi:LDH2 family malate/lactate/ureidoglycolate dehydrogenase